MAQQQQQLQQYFDALIGEYDALQRAVETNISRNGQAVLQLEQEIATAQREAIEFNKKFVAEPGDPAAAYAVLMSTALSSQARALNFARIAYEQAAQAGSDATKQFDEITSAAQRVNDAAVELTREWSQSAPFVGAWQQTVESFTTAATPTKAKK